MFGNDYYYDVDSELYYCGTRWYNPLWCRFISGDDIRYFDSENIGCVNMFAYCNNNPVMYADPTGHIGVLLIMVLSSLLATGISVGIISIEDKKAVVTGPDFEKFSFFTLNEKGELSYVSAGGYVAKKEWVLNDKKTSSINFSFLNLGINIKNPEKIKGIKSLFDLDASICKLSIDTKYVDVNISLGINTDNLSIDFGAVFTDAYNWLKGLFN